MMSDDLFKQSRIPKVIAIVAVVAVVVGIAILVCISLFSGLAGLG